MQSARGNIAVLFDPPCVESNAEYMEFIDSLLADNKYVSPVVQRVEDGVWSPKQTQRVSKAANELPASTFLPGGGNPWFHLHSI